MNKPPAYQYYPDKWADHTDHLSDSTCRTYSKMRDWMWAHDINLSSMPMDPEAIAILINRSPEQVTEDLGEIQNPHMKLLKEIRGRYVCKILREQWKALRKMRVQKSEAGKESARKRKEAQRLLNDSSSSVDSPLVQNGNEPVEVPCNPLTPTPVPSPTPSPKKKKIKRRIYTSGFDVFWEVYPRKVGKGNAFDAWQGHGCEAVWDNVMDGIKRHISCDDWKASGGQFIPHPATWLNGERWLDEPKQGYKMKDRP